MQLFINISLIVVGVLLVAAILLQSGGAGLGAAFGGSDTINTTRRGSEKFLFNATVVLSTLFLALAAARIFI